MSIADRVRNPYTKEAVWIERVRRAVNSTESHAQWCRKNGIHDSTFRSWKLRLKRRGLLPQLMELAGGFVPHGTEEKPSFFTLCPADVTYPIHFASDQIDGVSFDQLYWRIRTAPPLCPTSGDLFLFLRQDRRTVYGLRYCGRGYRFTRSSLDKASLPWPGSVTEEGVSDLTRAQLHRLLELTVE